MVPYQTPPPQLPDRVAPINLGDCSGANRTPQRAIGGGSIDVAGYLNAAAQLGLTPMQTLQLGLAAGLATSDGSGASSRPNTWHPASPVAGAASPGSLPGPSGAAAEQPPASPSQAAAALTLEVPRPAAEQPSPSASVDVRGVLAEVAAKPAGTGNEAEEVKKMEAEHQKLL
eukprot:7400385-Pyramimonas_sp.AAC.1